MFGLAYKLPGLAGAYMQLCLCRRWAASSRRGNVGGAASGVPRIPEDLTLTLGGGAFAAQERRERRGGGCRHTEGTGDPWAVPCQTILFSFLPQTP